MSIDDEIGIRNTIRRMVELDPFAGRDLNEAVCLCLPSASSRARLVLPLAFMPSVVPAERRRFNGHPIAKPFRRFDGIGSATMALHSVNWGQTALLAVIADAIGVVRQIFLQIPP